MKHLFGILLCLAAIFSVGFAQMQSEFGFVASKHKSAAVVSLKLGEIVRPLGLGFNLDALSFAGVSDVAVGGFAVAANFPLAQNVGLKFGPGLNFSTGQKPIPCAYFSMSWRL